MTPHATTTRRLPEGLRLGPVHLAVTDIDRSLGFYRDGLGLSVQDRRGRTARLGAGGEDLLVLTASPEARPAGRHAGLYHVALLQPSRHELARAVRRLAATGTAVTGASDHGVSEAVYLDDPDGNGIELAADRPPDAWPVLAHAGWDMGPRPLDVAGLVRLADGEDVRPRADPATVVGHIHLHVGDIPAAVAFYRDVVGFDVTLDLGTAAFLSAGGYHHHLGLNVWRGRGVPSVPPGRVGLVHWSIVLPSEADLVAVRERIARSRADARETASGIALADPWGMILHITADASSGSRRPAESVESPMESRGGGRTLEVQ